MSPVPVLPTANGTLPGADYRRALDALFRRTTGVWRLGLQRVTRFLHEVGNPHLTYPVFHVAGTNGKGSTVTYLDGLLRAAGFRVGRYTSPHLVDFRERIAVNGEAMPPEAIVAWLDAHSPNVDEIGATFFEVTTTMAFDWFRQAEVDVAVVEVGLGGRLDATNVVHPVAASVTSIGYDHQDWLGVTLEEIAGEKAGIFKPGVPAIIGDAKPEVQAVLRRVALEVGSAPILVRGEDFDVSEPDVRITGTEFTLSGTHPVWHGAGLPLPLHTGLVGRYQAVNAAVALAMVAAAGPAWQRALSAAAATLPGIRLPGRFHRHGAWIFDVAHNPEGARTIVDTLAVADVPRPLWALVTVLNDKDWRGILHTLAPAVDGFVITDAPTAPASRRWDVGAAGAEARSTGRQVVVEPDFEIAMRQAEEHAATILATGSFHTVGDVMERLQVNPLNG